jgi:hypothetical protein
LVRDGRDTCCRGHKAKTTRRTRAFEIILQEKTMWRFMVRLMTDIDFADGDEASDEAVRNYLESSSPTPFRSRRESRAPKEQRRRVESVSVTRTGARSVVAACANCGRSTDVSVDLLCDTLIVPQVGRRIAAAAMAVHDLTRPAWHTRQRQGFWLPARTAADVLGDRPKALRRGPARSGPSPSARRHHSRYWQ